MRILSLGDRALTVEFASGFDDSARQAVVSLDNAIALLRDSGDFVGVLDVAPTFRSLTVHYDPLVTSRGKVESRIRDLADSPRSAVPPATTSWRFPVFYGGSYGPDLPEIAVAAGLSEAEVVDLHTATEVVVHMLGFLPGFAFMGDIAPKLRRPRRIEPRVRVRPGSVAIADRLTAVYPWESPGGWNLIGYCPIPLFNKSAMPPSTLAPGDRVRFEAVSEKDATGLAASLRAGEIALQQFKEVT